MRDKSDIKVFHEYSDFILKGKEPFLNFFKCHRIVNFTNV